MPVLAQNEIVLGDTCRKAEVSWTFIQGELAGVGLIFKDVGKGWEWHLKTPESRLNDCLVSP